MARSTLIAIVAGAVVGVLVIVGTVLWFALPQRGTELAWGGGSLSASAGGVSLDVKEAPFSSPAAEAMYGLVPTDYVALRPLEITASAELPESGATLTWTLPVALPPETSVTFAYFDEHLSAWVSEFTSVSDDRLTVTAVVDHLSMWDVFFSPDDGFLAGLGGLVEDVIDGLGEGWERGSAQLFRFARDVLGVSAQNPSCEPTVPTWVDEAFATDNVDVDYGLGDEASGTAGVLLCAGSDPSNPATLQVKAAANRGYGFPVVFAEGVEPVAAGASDIDPTLSNVLNMGATMFTAGAGDWSLTPSTFVFATQEYTATFDQATVRDAGGGRIISFELPNAAQVIVSAALNYVWEELGDGSETVAGILAVLSMVQDCDLAALDNAQDAAAGVAWLAQCAGALDIDNITAATEVVADTLFDANDPAIADSLRNKAGLVQKVISKLKLLIIFSVAQTFIDYLGDIITEQVSTYPAWFVQVTLGPEQPTVDSLFGTYTWRGTGGFTTKRIDAEGVRTVDCSGCGDVSIGQQLVGADWNGSCFDVINSVDYAAGHTVTELFLLCPAGFGGPGDDTVDRLAALSGGALGAWAMRD